MCVVSMVMDHYGDEWVRRYPQPHIPPQVVMVPCPLPAPAAPSADEIEEFRRLLERAREYDRRHNEPDCELEEKRRKLLDLAKGLGIDISFVEAK